MDALLAQYGLTQTDLVNVIAIMAILIIVLGVLRTIFRWTRTIFRMGCLVVLLIGGILLLMAYLNPVV